MVLRLEFKNLNLKLKMSKQHNGVPDVDSEDVDMDSSSWCFCSVEQPKRPGKHLASRQWCRRSHLSSRFFERISIEKKVQERH